MRVLELGGVASGYAGRLFVRAGADVVRIAAPAKPLWCSDTAMDLFLHTDKRAIATDNKELLQRLSSEADLVICETSYADEFEALRDSLKADIVVAITPFGLTGPKRNWHATPNTLLAQGGYTYLMGDQDKAPLSLPGHYLEFQTGALAYTAALASYYADHGEVIDIGMFETLMSLSQFTTVRWHCTGTVRGRHGSDFWFVSPSDLFRCQDGWVYINIVPSFWDAFLTLIDVPELVIDERFQTNDGRMAHREPLLEAIGQAFAVMTRNEIEQRAVECRVPLGVVRTLEQVLSEPHLLQRGFFESLTGEGKTVKGPGNPFLAAGETRQARALRMVEGEG